MKHFLVSVIVIVGLLALCFACKVTYDLYRLSVYRCYIEARYAPQIALIEQNCLDSPKGDPSDEDYLKQQEVVKIIRKSLSGGEIYSATWSDDGHHGAAFLKPFTMGSIYYLKILGWSHDAEGHHSLYYGKTSDNRNLLVYEGWVQGGGKSYYEIVFLLDEIKNAANTDQPQRPPAKDQPDG